MEIHLVSSLTPEDENKLAPAVLTAIGRILDRLPVTYSVRIETSGGNAIHHHHTAEPQAYSEYLPEVTDDPLNGVRMPKA